MARSPDYGSAQALLRTMLAAFPQRIAAVSSFGAESAVLLHMLSEADPSVPVIFLDTGKLFAETLRYRDMPVARLGLTDVRSAHPDTTRLSRVDPDGQLWQHNADLCCWNRKVEPLAGALNGFAAWITGRKRLHGGGRAAIDLVEPGPDGRIKINPLASWGATDIARYFAQHDLPQHPLIASGYRSIGCAPCTSAVADNEPLRAGRWRAIGKTECGIHLAHATMQARRA